MQQIASLFNWIWDTLGRMTFSIAGYTFSLRGVFITSIMLTVVGFIIGKLINPWSGDEE